MKLSLVISNGNQIYISMFGGPKRHMYYRDKMTYTNSPGEVMMHGVLIFRYFQDGVAKRTIHEQWVVISSIKCNLTSPKTALGLQ